MYATILSKYKKLTALFCYHISRELVFGDKLLLLCHQLVALLKNIQRCITKCRQWKSFVYLFSKTDSRESRSGQDKVVT